ncbi:MAG: 30S ribosome-binding factor RbfA [Chloroflexi bacterium]|nr:30S ribosome-binding factor RbfA [Chloroflexota bacterium]
MSRRALRVNELLRAELSVLLQRTIRDPRLNHMLSITSVSVSKDLKQAQVYVSAMGTEEEKAEVFQGLKSASPFLRRTLGSSLSLRYIPRLTFHRDDSLENAARLTELIDRLNPSNSDGVAS